MTEEQKDQEAKSNEQETASVPAHPVQGQAPALARAQDVRDALLPEEVRVPIATIIQEKNHLLKQNPHRYQLGMICELQGGEILSKVNEAGEQYVSFIPIHFKRLWVCKNPREEGHRLFDKLYKPAETIFTTENPADPRIKEELQYAKEQEANPRVIKYLQFLAYVEGYEMPVILSFGKSSRIAGENLLNRLIFAKNGPMAREYYENKYRLITFKTTYNNYDFFTVRFEKSDPPTEPELKMCRSWDESIARKAYRPDVEDFDEGTEGGAEEPAAPRQQKDDEGWGE